jgi:hypothetical protein
MLFMAKRLIFVKSDGTPCTTRSGEKANSGAPPVLVAFGDYDAGRLQQFAAAYGGALVEKWQLFGEASLFQEAAERSGGFGAAVVCAMRLDEVLMLMQFEAPDSDRLS